MIKEESLETDADWLLEKLKLNHLREAWQSVAFINQESSTDKLARHYFSQVTKKNITRLYHKYQLDFEMFGYEAHVDKFISFGL